MPWPAHTSPLLCALASQARGANRPRKPPLASKPSMLSLELVLPEATGKLAPSVQRFSKCRISTHCSDCPKAAVGSSSPVFPLD